MAYSSGSAGAFTPIGNTVTFLGNTAAPTAVQVVYNSTNYGRIPSYVQYRIFNSGSALAFIGVGPDPTTANNNANVVSTSWNSLPILPGSLEIVSYPTNSYFTAITASGTGNTQIYITPGVGV